MTLSALPAHPAAAAQDLRGVTLADLAEITIDLAGFDPALVREIAARMPVHTGAFTLMAPPVVAAIATRHHTLGTLVVSCHLSLHLLHAGTGTHPVAIADLYAADVDRAGMDRPPLLALLLLAPGLALARAWAVRAPDVTTVEDALDRWDAPSLIEVGTALARAAHPAFGLSDD